MNDEKLKQFIRERPIPAKLIRDLQEAPLLREDDPILNLQSGILNLQNGKSSRREQLSLPERHVLLLSSHGWTTKQIARALWKSPHTVTQQRRAAYAVLRARNACHAVGLALRMGLID